ncbi:MAG: hypothetical protein A2934_00780 [Candidatus Sungbacteria bacterium RIFCSPLOWO2_01_FULL_47_10]|uniref:Uncharacterized protein n=1 Tax=Candidatus Sungbacteria bacterium RIFCSPLOWO2_01_FULL_47_10 TaxID=1802276 RepID=A0A1G2KYG3_9BACT|nr:MAG: hypothetical protein A2934_00780 [Candidatus Sungbacteria bacterium RIFCSPLOWO2_01_FULL_47_10]
MNNLELTLESPNSAKRIAITNQYAYHPSLQFPRFLFSQFALLHLLSDEFPHRVRTNFLVDAEIKSIIDAMYASMKKRPPVFAVPNDHRHFRTYPRTNPERVAIAYSGGKDSMWNLMRAEKQYGMDNVLVIHIHGLNKGAGSEELAYTKLQQEKIGFRNLKVISIKNSAGVGGHNVMRSRDIFLAGIAIPEALAFGASKIMIEGFSETSPDEPFSGQEKNMIFFNHVLGRLHIPVRIDWENKNEMDVMKELVLERPEWVTYVCNCFLNPLFRRGQRPRWHTYAPSFPLLDSQCGSCVKCRITNLGRLLYDPAMAAVKKEDVEYFLKSCVLWYQKKIQTHADMIAGSFRRELITALEKYDLAHLISAVVTAGPVRNQRAV